MVGDQQPLPAAAVCVRSVHSPKAEILFVYSSGLTSRNRVALCALCTLCAPSLLLGLSGYKEGHDVVLGSKAYSLIAVPHLSTCKYRYLANIQHSLTHMNRLPAMVSHLGFCMHCQIVTCMHRK